jgi:hypothetical protein
VRRLVINADDLGFAPGVNRGINESHEAGTRSAASMMVTTPAFHEAVARVKARAPRLGVGQHLNLITGAPLSEAPSLVDAATGRVLAFEGLARRALAGRVVAADVRRECDAQLAAFKRKHDVQFAMATGSREVIDALTSLFNVIALRRGEGDIGHPVKLALLDKDLRPAHEWHDNPFDPREIVTQGTQGTHAPAAQ